VRTLVIHTAFLGDLVLATPLLDELRADPGLSRLALLTTPACAPLFEGDPRLDELILYDKRGADRGAADFLRVARGLARRGFDRVVSPHRSLRSALLARWTGARERIGFRSSAAAALYTRRVPRDRGLHEVDRNLALLKERPVAEGAPRLPSLHDDPAEEDRVRGLFRERGIDQAVALAPASVWPTKRWLPRRFAELAGMILEESDCQVLMLGARGDRETLREVREALPAGRREGLHDFAGLLGVRESYQALRLSRLAVVNDSAPLHLAQAARIPTLAVFGSTVPAFGFGPRQPHDRVFQLALDCIPCGIHGRRRCPLGTLGCMEGLAAGPVMEAVRELLGLDDGRPDKRRAAG